MEGASGAGCCINGTPAPSVFEHNEGSPSAPLFVSFAQVKEEPSKKKEVMKSEQEEEQWTEVIHWGVETVKANDEAVQIEWTTLHWQFIVFSLSAADQLHHIPHSVFVGSEA